MMVYKTLFNCPCLDSHALPTFRDGILSHLTKRLGGYSVAINAEKLLMAQQNPSLRTILQQASLPIPDGVGAVLAMRILHGIKINKVNFPKMVLECANLAGLSLFLLGATEHNNRLAAHNLVDQYPNILLRGHQHGFFENLDQIILSLINHPPDIVFIGMGSPRQEKLAAQLSKQFPKILFVCCGGAIDVLAGQVKPAPKWIANSYFEWLYRLIQQPWRIKRQIRLPLFIYYLIVNRTKRHTTDIISNDMPLE